MRERGWRSPVWCALVLFLAGVAARAMGGMPAMARGEDLGAAEGKPLRICVGGAGDCYSPSFQDGRGAKEPVSSREPEVTVLASRTGYAGAQLDPFLLEVDSEPISGVPVEGDYGGSTPYSVELPADLPVTLTAPLTANSSGASYDFVRWRLDGTEQPEGLPTLSFGMDEEREAVAVYEYANLLHVGPGGTYDFESIRDAIANAANGYEIVVAPGEYRERINFQGKNLVLRSTEPSVAAVAESTIIDGRAGGPVVRFSGTETAACVLAGFTIRNGATPDGLEGGGIRGMGTQATIRHNRIVSNTSSSHGGGLYNCDGLIEKNVIANNRALGSGGGGGLAGCDGDVENNLVFANTAAYGGGAYWCFGRLVNNTIFGNAATNVGESLGGGIFGADGLVNCIVWGNTAPESPQTAALGALPSYCCIAAWTGSGNGNTARDPMFIDAGGEDFRLAPASPCIDAGTAADAPAEDMAGTARPVGQGVDLGAYEYVGGFETVTLTTAVAGQGAVEPPAGSHLYLLGSTVAVAATPSAGWRFDHWEDGASGLSNPVEVLMTTNKTVTAVFVELPVDSPILVVSPTAGKLEASPGVTTVDVRNMGTGVMPWTASITSGTFLAVVSGASGTGDGTIQVTYQENLTGSDRTGRLWVQAPQASGSPAVVTFTQAAVEIPILSVTPTVQQIPYAAGTAEIDVANIGTGTFTWSAQVSSGAFLTVAAGVFGTNSGSIRVSYTGNPDPVPRTGSVRIAAPEAGNSPVQVTLTQGPSEIPILSVTPGTRDVGAAAGTTSFAVENTGGGVLNWTASVLSGDFLTISDGAAGTDSGSIQVVYEQNPMATPRTGTVQITAPDAPNSPIQVSVSQEAALVPSLSVLPGDRAVGPGAGATSFAVSNTGTGIMGWTATVASGDFLNISSGSHGTDGGLIEVAYAENLDMAARVGTIRVEAPDAPDSPVVVTVTQAPAEIPVLSVTPLSREVAYTAGTTTFAVSNAGTGTLSWTSSVVSGTFLSLSTGTSGLDSGSITVQYTENESDRVRTAVIRVTAPDAQNSPAEVTLVQAARPPEPILAVAPEILAVPKESGTGSFIVSNAGTGALAWEASVLSGDFLRITSGTSGTVTGTQTQAIEVSYEENIEEESRTGILRVTGPAAANSAVDVAVRQAGNVVHMLSVTPAQYDVGYEMGTKTFDVLISGEGEVPWSAAVVPGGFLSINAGASGVSSGRIQVYFEENTETSERTGVVRVTAELAANSPQEAQIVQRACVIPDAPLSIDVSQGTFSEKVALRWNSAAHAREYNVYRAESEDPASAALLTRVSGTTHDDLTAQAATVQTIAGKGCRAEDETLTTYYSYFYWVSAVNNCGESALTGPGEGYRGSAKAVGPGTVHEKALPAEFTADGLRRARADSVLALRLRSTAPIDGERVWARIEPGGAGNASITWWPVQEADLRDLWVVCQPVTPWPLGEVITVSAGAVSAGPAQAVFAVESEAAYAARLEAEAAGLIPASSRTLDGAVCVTPYAGGAVPALEGSVGPVYSVGLGEVFPEPCWVWLAVPEGEAAEGLEPYYCHGGAEFERAWYAGGQVEGWLGGQALLIAEVDEVSYVGFEALHGGTVQLRRTEALRDEAGASVAGSSGNGYGDLLFLAGSLVGLVYAGKRRPAGRR